jgi:hypothetical protein
MMATKKRKEKKRGAEITAIPTTISGLLISSHVSPSRHVVSCKEKGQRCKPTDLQNTEIKEKR